MWILLNEIKLPKNSIFCYPFQFSLHDDDCGKKEYSNRITSKYHYQRLRSNLTKYKLRISLKLLLIKPYNIRPSKTICSPQCGSECKPQFTKRIPSLEGRKIYQKLIRDLPGKNGSTRLRLLLLRTSLKSKGVPLAKGPLINLTHPINKTSPRTL